MCGEVGKMVANLHNLTVNFDEKRPNSLDLKGLERIFTKSVLIRNLKKYNEIMYLLKNEIDYLENHWPSKYSLVVLFMLICLEIIFFLKMKKFQE